MTKETFVHSINAIENQIKLDEQFSQNLGKAFPNAYSASLMPRNHFLYNALIRVLQEAMKDTTIGEYGMSWIEWFCYENDFGRKKLAVTDEDDNHIDIDDAEALYMFLIEIKNT